MKIFSAIFLTASLISTAAFAASPSTKAYEAANSAMHKDMNITYTGDADVDFVAGMIPHHQGAVDMARVQLKYGKDEDLRELAQRIITWQEAEIGFMSQWLSGRTSNYRAKDADKKPSTIAYTEQMHAMHKDMAIDFTGNADIDFARGMIPHHQAAIDMAWTLKEYGMDTSLRKMASEVIRSQGQEIALMQEWLAKQPATTKKSTTKTKAKKHDHTHH